MWIENLKLFKLHYSGDFEDWSNNIDDPIELFSAVSILAIYVRMKKILYIWIGSYASRTLKNNIVHFRALFSKNYSDLRVLRYITIDSKSEPYDFFENVRIKKEKLHQHIQNHENKLLAVISEIESLKTKADELFESEQYKEAINIAKKIIELAKKINDKFLEKDQEDFINEAQARAKNKKINLEIEKEINIIKNKIENLIKISEIIELHEYVENFKQKYKMDINSENLFEIRKLLSKEEKIWQNFCTKQEKIEELSKLEEQIKATLIDNDLKTSKSVLSKAKILIKLIEIDELSRKWNKIEEDYNEKYKTFINQIGKIEVRIERNQNDKKYKVVINDCQELIHIGELYKDYELIKKYKLLLEENKKKIEEIKEVAKREKESLEIITRKFEKLKEDVNKLRIKAKEALNKGLIMEASAKYKKIVSILKDFDGKVN